MAKRFTDTDKWKRQWFTELDAKAKLAFIYLCDQCDFAGIWPADFKLMSFQLGFTVNELTLSKWFSGKVIKIDGDKFFITAFFDFQYGDAKDGFRAKQAAIAKLTKLGLMGTNLEVARQSPDSPPSVLDTPSRVECSVVDSFEEGVGETFKPKPLSPDDLLSLWATDRGSLPGVEKFTEARRNKAKAQLAKYPDPEHWKQVLTKWRASSFVQETWRPTIDDWLNENKRIKTLEGQYANRPAAPPRGFQGPKPIVYKPAEEVLAEQAQPANRADPQQVRELLNRTFGYKPSKKEGA